MARAKGKAAPAGEGRMFVRLVTGRVLEDGSNGKAGDRVEVSVRFGRELVANRCAVAAPDGGEDASQSGGGEGA